MKDTSDITTQMSSATLLEFMFNAKLVDVRIAPIGVERPFDGADILAQEGVWLTLRNGENGMEFRIHLLCPLCKNTIHFDKADFEMIESMIDECYLGDIQYREFSQILANIGPLSLHMGKMPHSSIGLVFVCEHDPEGGAAFSVHPLIILYAKVALLGEW